MFWQSLEVIFFRYFVVILRKLNAVFPGTTAPNKWTIWIYMDGINRTKGPFVMFMGHIGVPTKESRQSSIGQRSSCAEPIVEKVTGYDDITTGYDDITGTPLCGNMQNGSENSVSCGNARRPWCCQRQLSSSAQTSEKKRSLGRDYHPLCLKCQQCQRQLTPGQHAEQVTGD
ncbi:uncharacterized protein LOC129846750 isoform X3 [Salvelinus fontinalis]|uniref:uncharacterized protein LOC129846750 isoform X3 n=1 Tax=Salvelinus fontinalis TaxID=8038 RepID=UPI0024855869|nr:uncharacterized protein LOC129846750 isoform X3 [Salvelinus fontinalis]